MYQLCLCLHFQSSNYTAFSSKQCKRSIVVPFLVWHGAAVRHIGLVVGRPVVEEGGSVQRVFGLVALPCSSARRRHQGECRR